MGYCYSDNGLVCDICGRDHVQAGSRVLKRRCPHDYCPPTAMCKECYEKSKPGRLKRHAKCKELDKEYTLKQQDRGNMLNNGMLLRSAALRHDDRVKVIFKGIEKEEAYWMSPETYHSIALGANVTISDFEKNGSVIKAQSTNIYDAEVKK